MSKVIQYVVVMGQGYGANPLLDMRIQDINVVSDPNKRLPEVPEPAVADGTSDSQNADAHVGTNQFTDNIESDAVVCYRLVARSSYVFKMESILIMMDISEEMKSNLQRIISGYGG